MDYTEIFGALAGALYVWLEIKQKRSMWIVGGLSALVYMVIFANSSLYASLGLQLYYVVASIYGWYQWQKLESGQGASEEGPTTLQMPLKSGLLSGIVAFIGYFILWFILKKYTTDPSPALDALIATLSMLATYWVANKYIWHWILWIITNLLALVLYLSTGLYATSLLYLLYLIASIVGFIHWRKFRKVLI